MDKTKQPQKQPNQPGQKTPNQTQTKQGPQSGSGKNQATKKPGSNW